MKQKFSGFFRFFLLVSCLILIDSSYLAAATTDGRITDIRFWQSPEEAQIVIDLTYNPKITPVNSLTDGTIFFDIESCSFRPGRQAYTLNNQFLHHLSVQEKANGSTRIFYKVPEGIQQRTFFLPKTEVKADRIVIFLSESAGMQRQRRANENLEVGRLKAGNIKIVVLDPGHGGEDPGARQSGIIEKDYVLRMSQMIKAFFDRDPRYRAILTRTGDYIIPLDRRSKVAENLQADAFVSIHANANRKRSVRGIEVYYESHRGASGQAEQLVAEAENQQDLIGGVGLPTESSNKTEIFEKQAEVMFQSGQLAERVERRMGAAVPGLPSRGVKRAGFKVLHSLRLPSILVELGYMSNPTDAAYLKHGPSQQRLAQSIYLGIKDFLENTVPSGKDAEYISYVQQVEAEKKVRAERLRKARERKAALLKNSKPYKVQKGETVAKVASRHKVSVALLCEVNGISKKTKLKAGQVLRIPAK